MNKMIEFLRENNVQYLATIGLDGKPKVRPFQFMLYENDKIYFCTSNQKEVFKEMKVNNFIQISTISSDYSWLRLSGEVIFINDLSIKNKIVESNSLVKKIYKTGANPNFEVFYLNNIEGIISNFSGNPPYVIKK